MKQYRLLYKMVAIGILASVISCTSDFDEINKKPYDIPNVDPANLLVGIQSNVVPVQENLHQFVEGLSGGEFAGYAGSIGTWGEGCFATYNPPFNWNRAQFDDIMSEVYPNYLALPPKTKNPIVLSLADLYRVAAMHRLTDAYGPIPYSKVGKGENLNSLSAPYDSQEVVYKEMIKELDEVINVLTDNRSADPLTYAKYDKVYDGKIESWVKFANSLKLRMAIRMSYIEPAFAQQVAEEAVSHSIGVITSNSDNAFMKVTKNPWNLQVNDWDEVRAGADIISYMNGYNDPRRAAYFTKSTFPGDTYVGMRGGVTVGAKNPLLPCSKFIVDVTTPLMWMNAAEIAFLRAEGALRGWNMGGLAEDLYNKGIELSFEQHGAAGVTAYETDNVSMPAGYTYPLGNTNYNFSPRSSVTIKWVDTDPFETRLERIITQKWIAIFPMGNEAWAEFRRTGYPKLAPVVENKSSGAVPVGSFIKRLTFSSTEYKENANNVFDAIGLLNGPDNMGTKLWWDKKN